MNSQQTHEKPMLSTGAWLAIIAGILIVGIFGGIMYLKNNSSSQSADSGGQMMSGGPRMMSGGPGGGGGTCANGQPKAMLMLNGERVEACGAPTLGEVTAVAADSLTIETSAGAKTFAVTDETKIITRSGGGALADVAVGSSVAIIPSEDDANRANYVLPPQGGSMN